MGVRVDPIATDVERGLGFRVRGGPASKAHMPLSRGVDTGMQIARLVLDFAPEKFNPNS